MTGTRIRTLIAFGLIVAGVVMALACSGGDDIQGSPCKHEGDTKYASNGAVYTCEFAKPGQPDSGLIWWLQKAPRK